MRRSGTLAVQTLSQIDWLNHLKPAEAAELEKIAARSAAIDAERRRLTNRRRTLYDRARDRAKKAGRP